MKSIWKFLKDEDGLELTEYAVIGALIVLATIAIIVTLGQQITSAFTRLSGALTEGGITAQ
jgi:pilus assembly protein Flp/PilA